jgi:type VI secretion system VasD/TssJ family lipoprotein
MSVRLSHVLPLLALALLVGCGQTATLRLRGVAPLNRNDAGESTPVDVRIYQLRGDERFRKAAFEKLWTEDEKALGDDRLAAPRVVSILPGGANDQPLTVELGDLAANTRYLGLMALFGKADAKDNRTLVLTVDEANRETIVLNGYSIRLHGAADSGASADGKAAAQGTK